MNTATRVAQAIESVTEIDATTIKPESHLFDDLDFDSLLAIELVIELEQEFECELDDDDLEEIKTVAEIIALMDKQAVAA